MRGDEGEAVIGKEAALNCGHDLVFRRGYGVAVFVSYSVMATEWLV